MDTENETPQNKLHHPATFARNAQGEAAFCQDLPLLDIPRIGGQVFIPGFRCYCTG